MKFPRLPGCLVLFIALAGLIVLLAWVVLRFSLPKPAEVMVGALSDYPAGQAPRLFAQDSTPFYVLNVDGDLVALYGRSLRHTRCLVSWDEARSVFIDPCLGTRFTSTGEYTGGGPPQELIQLPLQVKYGQVWVETNLQRP